MKRIGIIGSGFGMYGLLPSFSSLPDCQVVAFCGKKTDRVMKECEKYHVSKIYSDWKKMLDIEELDVVAIAVIPQNQYEICLVAIKKGINIFAEKPLAATLFQAKELLKFAEAKKIIHSIDFIFPEISAWEDLKKMLKTQQLGKISKITLDWDFLSYDIRNKLRTWKTDASLGGGALSFYFSHCLYYLEWLFGSMSIKKSSFEYAKESLNKTETQVNLEVEFENGAIGLLHIQCNNKLLNEHKLVVYGEKKNIVLINSSNIFDDFILTEYKVFEAGKKYKVSEVSKDKSDDDRIQLIKKIAKRFIKCCDERKQMVPSFRDGLRVQELIEEIRMKNEKE